MTNQEQAYINGFVKRANQYGYSNEEAYSLLGKTANAVNVNQAVLKHLRGLTGKNALRYGGRGLLAGAGVGGVAGAIAEPGEGESRLENALKGAAGGGLVGGGAGGVYGYGKGLSQRFRTMRNLVRKGPDHVYETEILKKAPSVARKESPTARGIREDMERKARNATRKANNMVGKPIDIAAEVLPSKTAQHISPSKILENALRRKQLKHSLIGGGVGAGAGAILGALPEPNDDETRLKNALIGAGGGGLVGGALGYTNAAQSLQNLINKKRKGSEHFFDMSEHDAAVKAKRSKKDQNVERFSDFFNPPSGAERSNHLADELARNASKLKPDSVEDVISEGYKAPRRKGMLPVIDAETGKQLDEYSAFKPGKYNRKFKPVDAAVRDGEVKRVSDLPRLGNG